MVWNLPNILTLSRFLIAALFLYYAVHQDWQVAFWLFAAGAMTDMIDGSIARLFKQKTAAGAFLDPMADKFLMLFGFLSLAMADLMPIWLTVLVIARDLMIGFGVIALRLKGIALEYRPTFLSKLTTFSQILTLCLALVTAAFGAGELAWGYDRILAGTMTLITFVQYFGIGLGILRKRGQSA